MQTRNWVLLFFVMTGLIVGCARKVNIEQERSALLAADNQASAATSDLPTLLKFYAADAAVYPQGMPIKSGTEAIKGFFTAVMTPGMSIHWTPTKADVSQSGEVGYTTGAYEMNVEGQSEKGKYVTVWKKQSDGSWKIVEDIFNADAMPAPKSAEHKMVAPTAIAWGDAPPSLPRGAKLAVLSGDPSKPEAFVMRAQFPAGYKIPAHWHPTDELVTVISGTLALGMGDQLDEKAMQTLPAGGYAALPAKMHHYAMAKVPTVVQIHGTGPFAINYINPADDPSKQPK